MANKKQTIEDLKFDEHNFNDHTAEGMQLLEKSIEENGFGRSIVVDKNLNIIGGNGVVEVSKKRGDTKIKIVETEGDELVVVKRTDLDINTEKARNLAAADNAVAAVNLKWNEAELKAAEENWNVHAADWGVKFNDETGGVKMDNENKNAARASLAERFIIPPFSIFNTSQGYWQNRKRAWLNLGIRSNEGRAENLMKAGEIKDIEFQKSAGLKEMSVKTSIFDPVLCEICYRWFCPENGKIFDPFAGGSVRGVVASYLGFNYHGIDLRQEQIDANEANAKEIGVAPHWYCDDSQNADKYIEDESADLVFSCPPYFDLEEYSDDKRDLSNMSWEDFKTIYRNIIRKAVGKLKQNRFAIFVVGDVRDKKGFYRDFIGETKRAFIEAGALLYNEAILYEHIGAAKLRTLVFAKYRKIIKVHQNVLIFYKGDPKAIKENFAAIDFSDEDLLTIKIADDVDK